MHGSGCSDSSDGSLPTAIGELPVVLTGASGGIGQATTEVLVTEGRPVLGLDHVAPPETQTLAEFYQVDLREPDAVAAVGKAIVRTHRALFGFVHCAGLYPIVSFQDYTRDLWDEVHAVNVRSAFELVHRLSPSIVDGGRIVLVSSGAAHLGSHDVGYSASKAGVLGLMRSLAMNMADRNILVNAVCPGPIHTAMSERMSPKSVRKYKARIPLHRFGTPSEVALTVAFLLSPKNTYLTGASIDVAGGLYMR